MPLVKYMFYTRKRPEDVHLPPTPRTQVIILHTQLLITETQESVPIRSYEMVKGNGEVVEGKQDRHRKDARTMRIGEEFRSLSQTPIRHAHPSHFR